MLQNDSFEVEEWKKLVPNDRSLESCFTDIYFYWNGNLKFRLTEAEGGFLLEDNIYIRSDRENRSIIG